MSEPSADPVTATPSDDDIGGIQPDSEAHSGGLRRTAARGTIINAAFQAGLAGVGLLRRVLVVAFLTTQEFGLWGILIATLVTLSWLKEVGIADKYIQQSEPDQERAFQKAFTLELGFSLLFFVLFAGLMPVYAAAYDAPELIVPGIVLAAVVPITVLQTPIWIHYRRLNYLRQRTLSAIDPIVALVVTMGLGMAGFGYWCLVIGVLAGALAAGIVATATSPYPLRLRYDGSTLREYASFSWPLLGLGMSNLITVQGTLLVSERSVGLAGIGAIGLAGTIATFADRLDTIISQTLYPVVCRVADRVEVMHEAFVKSNRLTLMWAVPFGAALALFAGDLIEFVFGEEWRSAEGLLIGLGLTAALGQMAYNWTIFMRAVDNTKPLFKASLVGLASFVAIIAPSIILLGLDGYIVGFALGTIVQLAVRAHYLRGIFPGFGIITHLLRSIAPTIPAAGIVLLIRLVAPAERELPFALFELAVYIAATILFTLLFERKLLLEVRGYLRSRTRAGGEPLEATP